MSWNSAWSLPVAVASVCALALIAVWLVVIKLRICWTGRSHFVASLEVSKHLSNESQYRRLDWHIHLTRLRELSQHQTMQMHLLDEESVESTRLSHHQTALDIFAELSQHQTMQMHLLDEESIEDDDLPELVPIEDSIAELRCVRCMIQNPSAIDEHPVIFGAPLPVAPVSLVDFVASLSTVADVNVGTDVLDNISMEFSPLVAKNMVRYMRRTERVFRAGPDGVILDEPILDLGQLGLPTCHVIQAYLLLIGDGWDQRSLLVPEPKCSLVLPSNIKSISLSALEIPPVLDVSKYLLMVTDVSSTDTNSLHTAINCDLLLQASGCDLRLPPTSVARSLSCDSGLPLSSLSPLPEVVLILHTLLLLLFTHFIFRLSGSLLFSGGRMLLTL